MEPAFKISGELGESTIESDVRVWREKWARINSSYGWLLFFITVLSLCLIIDISGLVLHPMVWILIAVVYFYIFVYFVQDGKRGFLSEYYNHLSSFWADMEVAEQMYNIRLSKGVVYIKEDGMRYPKPYRFHVENYFKKGSRYNRRITLGDIFILYDTRERNVFIAVFKKLVEIISAEGMSVVRIEDENGEKRWSVNNKIYREYREKGLSIFFVYLIIVIAWILPVVWFFLRSGLVGAILLDSLLTPTE